MAAVSTTKFMTEPATAQVGAVRRVGEQQRQEDDGPDVEDRDAEHDRVDGAGDDPLHVLGLAARRADELDGRVGEDDALDDEDDGHEALREDAAALLQHRPAGLHGGAVDRDGEAPGEPDDADDQEGHERRDLHEGEPELELPEHLDGDEVEAQHDGQRDEGEQPLRRS
jgi:hypothetical protein